MPKNISHITMMAHMLAIEITLFHIIENRRLPIYMVETVLESFDSVSYSPVIADQIEDDEQERYYEIGHGVIRRMFGGH